MVVSGRTPVEDTGGQMLEGGMGGGVDGGSKGGWRVEAQQELLVLKVGVYWRNTHTPSTVIPLSTTGTEWPPVMVRWEGGGGA